MSEFFGRSDFITQESLEQRANDVPSDFLRHDSLAAILLDRAAILPAGAVFAVQAPWGRGKTDLLARAAMRTYVPGLTPSILPKALWINPWQYGAPDLLTPLVLTIVRRIGKTKKSDKKALMRAATSVIKAGISFGFKTAAVTLPGGSLYELATEPVEKLLEGLFDSLSEDREKAKLPDPDPVYEMANRFSELVDAMIENDAKENQRAERVLVFIDDIDRCLPHTQVALLEAIRFLTSANAKATFIISFDPAIARKSLIAHYGVDGFDPESYLDKMFHMRMTLPPLATPSVRRVISGFLDAKWPGMENRTAGKIIASRFNESVVAGIPDWCSKRIATTTAKTPRVLKHIVERICLFAISASDEGVATVSGASGFPLMISWLAMIERFPQVRVALQEAGDDFTARFADLVQSYGDIDSTHQRKLKWAAIRGLPTRADSPELAEMLNGILPLGTGGTEVNSTGELLSVIDRELQTIGI